MPFTGNYLNMPVDKEFTETMSKIKTMNKESVKQARQMAKAWNALHGIKQTRKKRKEEILSTHERQKRFREKKESLGFRQAVFWVDQKGYAPDIHKFIVLKINKKNEGILKSDANVRNLFLEAKILLSDYMTKGLITMDLFQDITAFYEIFEDKEQEK